MLQKFIAILVNGAVELDEEREERRRKRRERRDRDRDERDPDETKEERRERYAFFKIDLNIRFAIPVYSDKNKYSTLEGGSAQSRNRGALRMV